ncbi:OPT oligopeptide transporter [Mycena leptocephala]|nr:OPT oligopeptide transporter [Mycena leptocephala]
MVQWDSPEYANIPQLVRDVVGFEDDPHLPTLTFRVVVISTIFFPDHQCQLLRIFHRIGIVAAGEADGAAAPQLSGPLRPIKLLPSKPNPGPFSAKEHVLIGITGNAGSNGNWASNSAYLPANAKIYYDIDMNHAMVLFFGCKHPSSPCGSSPLTRCSGAGAVSIIGFSFTAFVPQILIYDPAFIFPVSLQQVTLYRTIHKGSDAQANRQMRGFGVICTAVFVWQFFPEYIFPMTAALAPLCWIDGHNKAASFVGSGMGGMGTLNVSNITSSVITQPFFVQAILFTGFVITMWILVPIAYFGNMWGSPNFSVMSNGVFTKNGSAYPFASLLTKDGQFNQTRYDRVGLAYAGAQYLWCIFFAYAAFISSFVWMALFAGPQILAVLKSLFTGKRVHADRLSNMMGIYPEVSAIEWISVFAAAFIVLLVIVLKGHVYMPLFTLFVALAVGAVATLPMSLVYAISGYRVDVGYFNELVYGYMLQAPGASRHPLGQLTYRLISGNVWYDAWHLIEDQKIGHYMHVPPRDVVVCQLIGTTVGIVVNYATMLWVLSTKLDYLREIKTDPNGEWTGQDLKSYNTAGIQYALVGPRNLFADASLFGTASWASPKLSLLHLQLKPGFFRAGATAPLLVWLLDRRFKKAQFHLWNTTILFSNMSKDRGKITTGPLTQFILGFIWNFWLYRYRYQFWKVWAYITGAARS